MNRGLSIQTVSDMATHLTGDAIFGILAGWHVRRGSNTRSPEYIGRGGSFV